jgi:hypothetical protein
MLFTAMAASAGHAETVSVRHPEGTLRGFLALYSEDGNRIGTGELAQSVHGDRVSSQLVYRFQDGSIDEERAVFTQRSIFRLVFDHHVQRGPSFPHPLDMTIDVAKGQVTTRDDKGTETKHMDLPKDLANGSILTLMKNFDVAAPQHTLSFLVAAPKPRLVKLVIKPTQEDPFDVGPIRNKALCMLVHIDIGGVAGVVAPLVGKQPGDIKVWIEEGDAPTFIREAGAFYGGGPTWIVELTSPVWGK